MDPKTGDSQEEFNEGESGRENVTEEFADERSNNGRENITEGAADERSNHETGNITDGEGVEKPIQMPNEDYSEK